MAQETLRLSERLVARFGDRARASESLGQVTLEVAPEHLVEVMKALRDERELRFEQLIDVCGVDYLGFGDAEWDTTVSSEGYSRGVEGIAGPGRLRYDAQPNRKMERRYAAVYHLLSVSLNHRVRVRCFCNDEFAPSVPSVMDVWSAAYWFEREAFDLYGIIFEGHPDLRRLLTDYGFVGHPFRKDFPLIGHVEVRYDPEKNRVVYEPVSIEPRVLVPRVVRDDSRYEQAAAEFTPSDRAGKPEGAAAKGT